MPYRDPEVRRAKDREYQARYREKNREAIRAYDREWKVRRRLENPEVRQKHIDANRRWKEAHPELRKEVQRKADAQPERKRKKAEREAKKRALLRAQRPPKEIKPWRTSAAGLAWLKQYQREYIQRRKEELKAYKRVYSKTPIGKAIRKRAKTNYTLRTRNNGGTATRRQWFQRCELYGFCCAYCGTPLAKRMEIDHIIPVAKGGLGWPSNLVPSCRKCNARKNANRWPTHLPTPKGHLP